MLILCDLGQAWITFVVISLVLGRNSVKLNYMTILTESCSCRDRDSYLNFLYIEYYLLQTIVKHFCELFGG